MFRAPHRHPPQIVLRVWESDYGVASVDPECIQLMLIFKINSVNVKIQNGYLPQWLSIPAICCNEKTITKASELMTYALQLCNDKNLQITRDSQIAIYDKYFMEGFANAFYFDCWLNDKNYKHAIKHWFNNVIPFPFNYFYLKKMRDAANERFTSLMGLGDPEIYKAQIMKTAKRCLADFAFFLRDGRPYLFGEYPTMVDITIYSYLSIAMQIPLPDSHLQNLVKSHFELVRFVRNINELYFPDMSTRFKYVEPVDTGNDHASTKALIFTGLFATSAMFLYAWSVGLIKPKFPSIGSIQTC